MMKIGEAAKRLAQQDVLAPAGVDWALTVANRNFIIHQYDEINRQLTWQTLARDLPEWAHHLQPFIAEAVTSLERPEEQSSS